MIDDAYLTRRLGDYIKEKFEKASAGGINLNLKEISPGHNSAVAVDWKYKGVECSSNFYIENGILNLFFELTFQKDEKLIKSIEKLLKSGRDIEKSSRFLSKPHREYTENNKLNPDKKNYIVHCKIKKNLKLLAKLYENDLKEFECLYSDIWGYLMKIPKGIVTGIIKEDE